MKNKQILQEINLNLSNQYPIHSESGLFGLIDFLYGGSYQELYLELDGSKE